MVEYGNDLSGWTPINLPANDSRRMIVGRYSLSDQVNLANPSLGSKKFRASQSNSVNSVQFNP